MGLNPSKGNMYSFVTHTWNPIRGKCPHLCSYCFVRSMPGYTETPFRLVEEELATGLGKSRTIFVGSSTDMWISESAWIKRVLNHCRGYPNNTYLFQSKAPEEMKGWIFPPNTILGTTLETDGKVTGYSMAPEPAERALALAYLKKVGYRTMVSIEPIMDFYLPTLVMYISMIEPEFVSIGADSKGHHLPEPNSTQVRLLIQELGKFTEVRTKPNLSRLLEGGK